jgi:hypothetical protein
MSLLSAETVCGVKKLIKGEENEQNCNAWRNENVHLSLSAAYPRIWLAEDGET